MTIAKEYFITQAINRMSLQILSIWGEGGSLGSLLNMKRIYKYVVLSFVHSRYVATWHVIITMYTYASIYYNVCHILVCSVV